MPVGPEANVPLFGYAPKRACVTTLSENKNRCFSLFSPGSKVPWWETATSGAGDGGGTLLALLLGGGTASCVVRCYGECSVFQFCTVCCSLGTCSRIPGDTKPPQTHCPSLALSAPTLVALAPPGPVSHQFKIKSLHDLRKGTVVCEPT